MKRRDELESLLVAWLDGELPAAEQRRVEALLRESAEARSLLDELRRLDGDLRALPAADPGEAYWADFTSRVEARLGDTNGEPSWYERLSGWLFPEARWSWARAVGAAAALSLVAYVGVRGFRTADFERPAVVQDAPPAPAAPQLKGLQPGGDEGRMARDSEARSNESPPVGQRLRKQASADLRDKDLQDKQDKQEQQDQKQQLAQTEKEERLKERLEERLGERTSGSKSAAPRAVEPVSEPANEPFLALGAPSAPSEETTSEETNRNKRSVTLSEKAADVDRSTLAGKAAPRRAERAFNVLLPVRDSDTDVIVLQFVGAALADDTAGAAAAQDRWRANRAAADSVLESMSRWRQSSEDATRFAALDALLWPRRNAAGARLLAAELATRAAAAEPSIQQRARRWFQWLADTAPNSAERQTWQQALEQLGG